MTRVSYANDMLYYAYHVCRWWYTQLGFMYQVVENIYIYNILFTDY